MSVQICQLSGSRGRSIDVYDNKCVITTDVTLGSIMTRNALDGQKTIFYIDVTGVQFKRCGLTIGYLQLETGSLQMNNQSDNMFSENTYTFVQAINNITNDLIQALHDYIVDRIEGYKYGFEPSSESLEKLLEELERTGNANRSSIILKRRAEKWHLEEAQKREAAQKAYAEKVESIREAMGGANSQPAVAAFLKSAESCESIADIKIAWQAAALDVGAVGEEITNKINQAARIERTYGSGPQDIESLVHSLTQFLKDIETV